MKQHKIGVMVESFRLGLREGITKAAEVGADGIQVYVTGGETAPENLSRSGRKEFRKLVADHGLAFSALCADYFKGFLNAETNDETVEKTKACMDLAVDLGTHVITSHIGTLPEDESADEWRLGREALAELAAHGEKREVLLASETGPESADLLLKFLETIPGKTIGVNYDPANLVMNGFDQLGGVKVLKDYIFHTHAKDATRSPRKEVPLSEGEVDFPRWVGLLDEIGYDGFLTIEREVGEDPVADIVQAVRFLRTL